jgi:hypothetical protein
MTAQITRDMSGNISQQQLYSCQTCYFKHVKSNEKLKLMSFTWLLTALELYYKTQLNKWNICEFIY